MNPERILAESFTSAGNSSDLDKSEVTTRSQSALIESSSEPEVRLRTAKRLFNYFLSKVETLTSEGTLYRSRTILVSTTMGAILGKDNV